MKTEKYWKKRIKQKEEFIDKFFDEIMILLSEDYQKTFDSLESKLTTIYLKIQDELSNGEKPLVSHLYQYNKYYETLDSISNELRKLEGKEYKVIEKEFTDFYQFTNKDLDNEFPLSVNVNKETAKEAISQVWCPDGKNWSDRIWKNKQALADKLRQSLVDIISTGRSHKELSKEIAHAFKVSFSDAERLVRTELCFLQNYLTLERYKQAGIEYYRVIHTHDDRFCDDVCPDEDEKYDINLIQWGINAPPFHPNCRCSVVPVLD